MNRGPRSLSLRLALMFAAVTTLLLGGIGFYLYHSLQREIAWRDDQALLGRLQRMEALIDDSASITALRGRPQLYDNMLGNRDSVLWIIDAAGHVLIEVNPARVPTPRLAAGSRPRLTSTDGAAPMRLACVRVERAQGSLTLIAGRLLTERKQMLAQYRLKLDAALLVGALLAFLLGALVSRHGLRPVRQLAGRAAAIDAQHLHLRLDETSQLHELQALSAALNQMLARLEAGFAQLERFSEDLAHEMRTPLTNLMGYTQQTLARDRTLDDYQSLLASNAEEYERLARMIDSMLFLARSEHMRGALPREQIDVRALVEQLCDYFEGSADERGMRLVNQARGTLLADPDLLRRTLANLIANAVRYGAPDSVVTIDSVPLAGGTEIGVRNHGPAIAPEHLPHLFERFYRCDPSRHAPGDSGGLGLAIVESIMQRHGGSASVASTDQGTRFSLRFP